MSITIIPCRMFTSFDLVDWRAGMGGLYTDIEMEETTPGQYVFHYTYPSTRLSFTYFFPKALVSRYTRIRNDMTVTEQSITFCISLVSHPSFQVYGEMRFSSEDNAVHLHLQEPVLEDRIFDLLPYKMRQELVRFISREIIHDTTRVLSCLDKN